MRNTNAQSLNAVINELIDAYRLRGKLSEVRIREAWEQLMGSAIANRTNAIYLKDKILTVQLNSSVLREELAYKKNDIRDALHKLLEEDSVIEIVLR